MFSCFWQHSIQDRQKMPILWTMPRVNRFRNTSCDLSDWEAGHLSVHPQSSDTIESATYVIFSRYEVRAPTPSAAAGQRCSGVALPAAPTRPPPTPPPAVESWPPYRPPAYATSVSEDGNLSLVNFEERCTLVFILSR